MSSRVIRFEDLPQEHQERARREMGEQTLQRVLEKRATMPGITWLLVAEFGVKARPVAMGRPRAFAMKVGNKTQTRIYNPDNADDWKGAVSVAAHRHVPAEPLKGPVRCDISWFMPRPQNLYRKLDPEGPILCDHKPDRDNLDKAVLDALTKMRFWKDDGQVCGGEIWKFYHSKTGRPGARIQISVPAQDSPMLPWEGKRK